MSNPRDFEIVDVISNVEAIARGPGLRARRWLNQRTIRRAEVHWYEAHGIGKKNFKIKRTVD